MCAIAVIALVLYWPSLELDFVYTWDDAAYVTNNPLVVREAPIDLQHIFLSAVNQVYSPLTILSFAVEAKLFGASPFFYHLNNVLLHLFVCLLLFWLAVKIGLSVPGAFFSAVLFAVHPMHVESVAWISERKDVLYAAFYLLALLQYVAFVKTSKKKWFYLSVFFGLCGMLAKPMALSLPLIMLLLDWFLMRPLSWGARIKEKAVYCLYIIPLALCSFWSLGSTAGDPLSKVLLWVFSFVFYIKKFFFPDVFLPHYALAEPVVLGHPAYMGSLLLGAVFIYSIIRYRPSRWFLFAWLYYFCSIFFLFRTTNVLSVQNVANLSQVADRFMYLPSAGFCLWLGYLAQKSLKGSARKIMPFVLVLIVIFLGWRASCQMLVWKNDTTLWKHAIRHAPQDPLGYINRGLGYEKRGQYDLAILDDTLAMQKNSGAYVSDLAAQFPQLNDTQLAHANAVNALLLNNPYYVAALRNRARAYYAKKDMMAARADCDAVLAINPQDKPAFCKGKMRP